MRVVQSLDPVMMRLPSDETATALMGDDALRPVPARTSFGIPE